MSPETPIELTNADAPPAAVLSLPRRKAPIIIAAAMAASLVTAVGAVIGLRLLSAAGDPAERMPASVAVFASIDLTPTSDQVRKLSKFTDPRASVDKLLGDVDAKSDLGGWMGPTVAVGVWAGKDDQPFVLVGLESKDDAAAAKGLANIKSKEDIGFVVRDGRVLIAAAGETAADNQTAAEAAWAESGKTPLSKHGRYVDARKWLSDEQLAVAYADLEVLHRLMNKLWQTMAKQAADEMGGLGDVQITFGQQPDSLPADLAGSLIAGVRVENDGYLVRYRNIGGKAQGGAVADALSRLGELPAAADLAAVAHSSDKSGSVMSMLPLLLGGFGDFKDVDDPTLGPDFPSSPLTEAESKELDTLMSKPESKLSAAEKKRLQELMGKVMAGGFNGQPGDIGADIGADIGSGMTDPGNPIADLTEFLADSTITVAVAGIAETPVFRALIELAKEPDADLRSRLQSSQGKDVKVEVNGRAVTITSASFPTGGAKLADDPVFKQALAGCSASAQIALYANAAKVLPADVRDRIGQVRAIGLCQAADGGEPTGSIRVLVA